MFSTLLLIAGCNIYLIDVFSLEALFYLFLHSLALSLPPFLSPFPPSLSHFAKNSLFDKVKLGLDRLGPSFSFLS